MRHAATLGEALEDFVAFQIGNSTGGTTYLHRSGDDFAFGTASTIPTRSRRAKCMISSSRSGAILSAT